MGFVHLHVHTEYSLLDGSNKIKEYVARVKELGMDSAAITDHGVMYGVIDFYREAKKQGIKPILGCEIYVAPGSRFDKEASADEDRYYHLVLLAENNKGYANLMKIVSKSFTEGYYYKPRADKDLLREYHEGLIALSGCLSGEVARYLIRGMYDEAKKAALQYNEIFGCGNYFLELQNHGIAEQRMVNQQLIMMSDETGIGLVATNDAHYTFAGDEKAHDILLCIQTGRKLQDENRMRYPGGQYYVKSPQEMGTLFSYVPQALENTGRIAQRCDVEIEFGVTKLPKYDVPEGFTAWEYLNKLCGEGLVKRYKERADDLKPRLDYELGVIKSMGYVDYFLIVWDFISYARKNGIPVGPGRGSSAGSIVAYCLWITDIDPIKYDLLFERFLNPERVSMPDIDVDFGYERRGEVIDYVVRKYGKDKVVQIVTFGTLAAKGVIRDVGRVMDLPYSFVDSIAKMIPPELNMTIDRALQMNRELRRLYADDERVKYLIDMSKKLEGLPRHSSTHAAGVVITQNAADEYVPLARSPEGVVTTQFTMTILEELGLLKMDFLGLRTLTVIQNAVRMVREKSPDFDIEEIDYDDRKVLNYIGTGKTDGIFQIESAGMKNFMKELKPQSLEDIIAGISLFRPGPMDFIPQYIKGKNDPSSVTYDTPLLEPILAPTYGCIVYQEQVMQIVRSLAGYTLARSDLLRRAMSKKKGDVMRKEREIFLYGDPSGKIPGCVANGTDEKTANKIYDEMIDFAKYAFNKSHAAAYAVVAYQTAFLKYYYPKEFMAALLTSVHEDSEKVAGYISECRRMNIRILPPHVNTGSSDFSAEGECIRYGMAAIKGVGRPLTESIVKDRKKYGEFKSLKNFITRLSYLGILNKRVIENFIKAGALDGLGGTRKQFMIIYTDLAEEVNREKKTDVVGQISMFDFAQNKDIKAMQQKMPDVGEYSDEELLAFEKEVLGVYISGHPLIRYEGLMKKRATATAADFRPDDESGKPRLTDGARVVTGGIIAAKTVKYTKKNQIMAYLTLEDLSGSIEVVVFPKSYERYRGFLEKDEKVFIKGRVSEEDEGKASRLNFEKVMPFERTERELRIGFDDKSGYLAAVSELSEVLDGFKGDDDVVIFLKKERAMKRLSKDMRVSVTEPLLCRLMNLYGADCVKVTEKTVENDAWPD